ncbi:1,3-beta-D-glucan synthase [Entomophthora muscae]|uniref:1,3-beta-D-glucan synthase n=1 Tax=Entomophthora muscae TaxID=34485 RepID=A0ACC2RRN5_9FUNG|nr:1,3-beta-D-glucan synthase [Entomophthora muscae]
MSQQKDESFEAYSPRSESPFHPSDEYDNYSDYGHDPVMRSPYHSSESSAPGSPRYDGPTSPAPHHDSSRNRESYYSQSSHLYPESVAPSARSSLNTSQMAGYSNIDVYSSLGNPKLSDSRYAAYAPSTESLLALIESKKPNFTNSVSSFSRASSWISEANGSSDYLDLPPTRALAKDYPWPAWSVDNQVPISKEEVWDVFEDLSLRFGFQKSSIRNQYDALMTMLDSRASRMTPSMALLTLHADYIGGHNANFRVWYFAAELYRDSEKSDVEDHMDALEEWWRNRMSKLSPVERIRQMALYLCIWGEGLNLRYLPELMCFFYKLALDYYHATEEAPVPVPEGDYLDRIVTPAYCYIRDQNYEVVNGQFLKRERDHAQVIGYDDINETFWSKETIERLVLADKKTTIMSLPCGERYNKLGEINWKQSIKKTYFERRTWLHILTNFSRVWIFHFSVFFMFWIVNSQFLFLTFDQYKNAMGKGKETVAVEDVFLPHVFTLVGAGGAIASGIALWATFCEFFFVERTGVKIRILLRRYFILLILFILNIAPTIAIFYLSDVATQKLGKSDTSATGKAIKSALSSISKENDKATKTTFIYLKKRLYYDSSAYIKAGAIIHMLFGIGTTLALTIIPPANLFTRIPKMSLRNSAIPGLINRAFTADYADLDHKNRATSVAMWAIIMLCKLVESYLALIWSFKSAFRVLVYMTLSVNCAEPLLKAKPMSICYLHSYLTMFFMVLLLLIMFFLDTYLWYIIITSMFSIANAFQMGISVLSPWKNIFGMMPKRIYTKILATSSMEIKLRPKMLCSQIWNAIVISMYRDHLISIDHVQKLLYQQVASDIEGKKKLKPPTFFIAQEDTGLNTEFYPAGSEAERRISFFASSLSTVIPEPLPVENMPTFTVFTPHYSEKILLSLREIIREDDQYTRVTLLEYLKSLYAVEWENFVKDTKILAEENAILADEPPSFPTPEDEKRGKVRSEDLPFYCIGFKSAAPEFTLRTRIWASLRNQTLYRTISGFMNYSKALKLLHRIENPELVHILGGNSEALETELDLMSRRKFNFLISMQRYTKFNKEERDNVEFLFKSYPDLQVGYLEDVPSETEGEAPTMFSCLIDGHCERDENGVRIPRYRVRIPGNPILGDGKSDNQNHAVIFTRGEYLQVIDANQDNYLEEALKIRSVLAEFEEYQPPTHSPYAPPSHLDRPTKPVAILGAREYIFSENIGILGDIAAGKEATFGTLTHRILSTVGGRLHYGHPDFLNMIFMNTRGGLSKAQKGLHLNEDIYAGMNAFQRGGRVKHSEYVQCGKGRDLGFCSVLNFNTKIGTGMGEQLLAREYYYLYTQLPLDRMLTLFYAHPGFHVNNMMIMFSIQVFMVVLVCVGVLTASQNFCDPTLVVGDLPAITATCTSFSGILNWIDRTILSVFIVLFITFLPLMMQVLSEQGFVRTASRLGKQVASCAPMFEIFTTQIYSNAILSNMSFGGARYIGTGRGFATTRQPFATLYSRFASSSIYAGMRNTLLLLFACLALNMFRPAYLYFWFTMAGMVLSPWVFNPHQFSLIEFVLDYRAFIRWMSKGNSQTAKDSWIAHCRYARTRITGQKRKRLGDKERKIGGHIPRAHRLTIFVSEVFIPFFSAILMTVFYATLSAYDPTTLYKAYIKSSESIYKTWGSDPFSGYKSMAASSGITKAFAVALAPIALNAAILIVLFPVSLFLGPIMSMCAKSFGGIIAAVAHAWSVINLVAVVAFLSLLENFDMSRTVLGLTAAMFIQRFIFALLMFLFLTREFGHDGANCAWWTGRWMSAGLGWMAVTQPLREFVCKIVEMSLFATDFIIAHLILIVLSPFTLIPYMDKAHSTMLFWLSPSRQIRPPIFSMRQKAIRRRRSILYGMLFITIALFLIGTTIIPSAMGSILLKIGITRDKVAKMDIFKKMKL